MKKAPAPLSQAWPQVTMLELDPSEAKRLRHLFAKPPLRLLIDAVAAGNSPGRLWVDDASTPQSALLWDRSVNYYLVGKADNEAFNQEASALIAGELAPEAASRGIPIFMVHCGEKAWEAASGSVFSGMPLERYDRVFFRFEKPAIPDWSARLPPGFSVRRIDSGLLIGTAVGNAENVREEIEQCWTSLGRFFERGFGFCMMHEENIVCWCTGEYFSEGKCGIGIETVEAYQRRGFATLTASAFVEHAFKTGYTPHWDSWMTNLPSVKVAEKVGFGKVLEHAVLFGRYPKGVERA